MANDDRCRWNPETWDAMVREYGLRSDDHSNANTKALLGLLRTIEPKVAQMYAAVCLRQQARTVGGGLLSDEPGLGKVRPAFLAGSTLTDRVL